MPACGQPPSLLRPRLSPAVIAVADSMVVCSCARAAVLETDWVRLSSICLATLPIEWTSNRIGTTSATTTSTRTIAITYPIAQLVVELLLAARRFIGRPLSDRVAEVADGLEAGVDRWQDGWNAAGLVSNDLDASDKSDERLPYRHQVKDDAHQAEGGGGDDQSGKDESDDGNGRHQKPLLTRAVATWRLSRRSALRRPTRRGWSGQSWPATRVRDPTRRSGRRRRGACRPRRRGFAPARQARD